MNTQTVSYSRIVNKYSDRELQMICQWILRPGATFELSINTRIVSYKLFVNEYSDYELLWNCQ